MKILYGVQGTGNGHITRARLMCRELKAHGLDVDVVMSGRRGGWPEVEEFGDYRKLKGISFFHHKGKIDQWRTLKGLSLLKSLRESKGLKLDSYDLLINDFEPLSAWAAKRAGLPSVSISHQAAFLSEVPTKQMGAFNRQLIRHFAPCDENLGVHWYHFKQKILPPIVDALPKVAPSEQVLVYLPFEELNQVLGLLQRFGQQQFICFHPSVSRQSQAENVLLHPICREGFASALASCNGVFCNAGFELPSEAMHAGKKLLVKPLGGQFEQASNALCLELLSLGQVTEMLDPAKLDDWLRQERAEAVTMPSVAAALAAYLCEHRRFDSNKLVSQLWQKVSYPTETQLRIEEMETSAQPEQNALAKLRLSS